MKLSEIIIKDNGGTTIDRYTAYKANPPEKERKIPLISFSEQPSHPHGLIFYTTGTPTMVLGNTIEFSDLPTDAQNFLCAEFNIILKYKYYVGMLKDGTYELFKSKYTPTQKNFGHIYKAVIGPFRTKRGAQYMTKYGKNNPHCWSVENIEYIAKEF